jgi:hypothetical protein
LLSSQKSRIGQAKARSETRKRPESQKNDVGGRQPEAGALILEVLVNLPVRSNWSTKSEQALSAD